MTDRYTEKDILGQLTALNKKLYRPMIIKKQNDLKYNRCYSLFFEEQNNRFSIDIRGKSKREIYNTLVFFNNMYDKLKFEKLL